MAKAKNSKKKGSDPLTDIGLTGLGLAAMTKKEIDKFVDDLMKKSELSKTEGKKMLNDLKKQSEKGQKKLEKNISQGIDSALKKMNVAKQSDIARLEKKIDSLNKKISGTKKKKS